MFLCGNSTESVNHLFVRCPFSKSIWSTSKTQLNLRGWQANLHELWTQWRAKIPQRLGGRAGDRLLAGACRRYGDKGMREFFFEETDPFIHFKAIQTSMAGTVYVPEKQGRNTSNIGGI